MKNQILPFVTLSFVSLLLALGLQMNKNALDDLGAQLTQLEKELYYTSLRISRMEHNTNHEKTNERNDDDERILQH